MRSIKIDLKDVGITFGGEPCDYTIYQEFNDDIDASTFIRMVDSITYPLMSLGLKMDVQLNGITNYIPPGELNNSIKLRKDVKLLDIICDSVDNKEKQKQLYNKIKNLYKL